MSLFGRLYRAENNFDFVGARKKWFVFSGVLLLIAVGSLLFRGLNLSVDFEGGTVVQAPNPADAGLSNFRDALSSVGQEGARVQLTGGGEGVRVQTEELGPDAELELVRVVVDTAGTTVDDASVESVGPTFGEQVTASALRALVIFLIVVGIFISWRFEWKMAVTALIALFHDLLITAGVYSVSGFEVTPATVIAILTILGYSLYDTVVVFDKIIEEIDEFGEDMPIGGIVNRAMNAVFMRSINTSLTSLLPVGSLLFVGSYLLGAATLREFALALFVGVAAGTYSSIFVASPLLALWKAREEGWQRAARRAARKGEAVLREPEPVAAAAAGERPPTRSDNDPRPPVGTGAVPRPPKRRKRRR
ncbi:MAG: protein translocase subunit SecF [Acidimicrobiia bacterium]|nr:protein translocase subunit SecF [Acidimicrobiia bacterium]MDH3470803.1 protein translocase subunit SecF [Acidimicrobiia bacterium]